MTQRGESDEQRVAMASRLRDAREYLGMSQDEVASVLKLSRPAITNIESGSRKVEAIELDQLAQLYGRPVTYFLSGEEADLTSSERVAFYARTLKGYLKKISPRSFGLPNSYVLAVRAKKLLEGIGNDSARCRFQSCQASR